MPFAKEEIITTPGYWDCECEQNYIHPKQEPACKICRAIREEQPNSRIDEVQNQIQE